MTDPLVLAVLWLACILLGIFALELRKYIRWK